MLDTSVFMNTYGARDLCLVRGKGARLYDDADRAYLDFSSGIGVASLGYADPEYTAAIARQASQICHTSNLYLNEPSAQCAKTLIEQGGFGARVFFCNSGAEANEGLIKLARKYSADRYGQGRGTVMTLKKSFHGRTVATVTATGQDRFHQHFYPFAAGFVYAEPTQEGVRSVYDESVCAVLVEPIQGEGGVYILPDEFLCFLRAFCDEHDLLLLVDEVQTGVGRTGRFWAHSYAGIQPDAASLAKGLGGGMPIGAVVASESCCDVLGAGDHGSTFGANPVCCAAANVVLSRVLDEAFLAQVCQVGDLIAQTVTDWGLSAVAQVRHRGLMVGLELRVPPAEVRRACRERGLLVLTAGENVLRLLPPLTLTRDEALEGLAILKEVLQ